MAHAAITVEVLPAGYGDCLFVTCGVDGGEWRLLVDTGPDEFWPELRARLERIPQGPDGKRHIDQAVITHIDHDHVGGAGLLFGDHSLGLTFGDVWFNAPPAPRSRSVAEGASLAAILGAPEVRLPWNRAFGGQLAATAEPGGFVEVPGDAAGPRIVLLSPAPAQLAKRFKVWDRELARLHRKESDKMSAAPASTTRGSLDLRALAAAVTALDRATANGSSIAFLLEHRGASILLAADAYAPVLVPAIQSLARQRSIAGPLKLDALKLSHHGSRANVTVDLLKAVQADQHIASTNGAIFDHPDDEALARVILHGGRRPVLWFNFDSERNRRWAGTGLTAEFGHEVVMPAAVEGGITLALGGAPAPDREAVHARSRRDGAG